MATRITFLMLACLGLLGCQQHSSSIDNLPPVSFAQPDVVRQPVAAPQPSLPPAASFTLPVTPKPAPQADVPAGWIPAADARPWRWIVIHHSATPNGSAQIIDGWHRDKGWDELGYHFVIDNGNGAADGLVEVGSRWTKQKWGAHTKTADNRFNDFGIGICLVGNFDVDHPTDAQMKSVAKLVAYLMKKYQIPADRVLGHGDAKPTDCPGKFMSVAQVRQMASDILAQSGDPTPETKLAISGELMRDIDNDFDQQQRQAK